MIRVFRKIRKKFFANKVSSYLVYAIGEIALVMIGILLALYVNNWNENRKLKSVINNTLSTISYDLEADTLSANTIIEFYKKNLEDSNRILNNEITPENYMDCLNCFNIVTAYQPFAIQTKGFEQLKRLTDETNTQKDSLISDITRLYSVYTPIIDKNNDRMETIVMKNFYELEKFPWFIDLATNKLSEEVIKYYTTSEDYKKRVASHRMLAVGNHLGATQKYKEDAIELINRIKQRLDKSQ